MASRRRRRKSIGKVVVDVEKRMRRVEKRPGARRLKNNVVTTEKIGFRAVRTKTIAADAVTANEAEFGVNVVSDTDPDIVKDGTTVTNPETGETKVYSDDLSDFVVVTDPNATAAAEDAFDLADSKNTVYRQNDAPTGGTYKVNDIWIDTNDGNKLYVWNGTSWVSAQDASIETAQTTANGKNKVTYSTSAPGSTANTAGDIWWQYAGGVIIGQWTGAGGTTWTQNTIGNAVIANLDAGKITTGFLSVAGTVKIGTAPTGSRVEFNPTGLFAYNGTTETFKILAADGSAEFLGTIKSGSTITGASFSSTNTSSGGITISERVTGSDRIVFYSGSVIQGRIESYTASGSAVGLAILGPQGDLHRVGFTAAGSIQLWAAGTGTIQFYDNNGNASAVISTTGMSISNPPSVGSYLVRNIRGFLSGGGFNAATDTTGIIGDIAVVYT